MTAKSGEDPMEAPLVTNLQYSMEISEPTIVSDEEDEDSSSSDTTEVTVSTVSENEVRFNLEEITLDGDGKIFYVMEKTHEYIEDIEDPGYYE